MSRKDFSFESHMAARTWYGQTVRAEQYTLEEVGDYLPDFELVDFGQGDNRNSYYKAVQKKPNKHNWASTPVGIVSNAYVLLQHNSVVSPLLEALRSQRVDIGGAIASLLISQYGERFILGVPIPDYSFNPGDGIDLQLYVIAQNSVERSCSLNFKVVWRRGKDGLSFWFDKNDELRVIHHQNWLRKYNIKEFVESRFTAAKKYQEHIVAYYEKVIRDERILIEWANKTVAKQFGVDCAARVLNVIRNGFDGKPRRIAGQTSTRRNGKVEQVSIEEAEQIPGFIEALPSLYSANNALQWVVIKNSNLNHVFSDLAKTNSAFKDLVTRCRAIGEYV